MDSDNRVSFYTDLSKHYEFQSRLKEILNHPESNITNCYFARSTSDRFCLFMETKNPKYSWKSIVFDFCNEFSKETDEHYLTDGLSQVDIDNLKPFLDGYAFKNSYEGLFFSSLFFGKELNPTKAISIYFKFTPDAEKRQYIIEGKKCELKEAVASRDELVYELKREKQKMHANLYKCNTYSFQHHKQMKYCIEQITKSKTRVPHPDLYVVEFYNDLEYLSSYIKSVSKVVDDQLVEVDVNDFITIEEEK